MAVVVSQTLPYSQDTLQLDSNDCWKTLFPLFRPSIRSENLPGGHIVFLNEDCKCSAVDIAAVARPGHFSTLLPSQHLSAIVIEGPEPITAREIQKTLSGKGLVLLRAGLGWHVQTQDNTAIVVETPSELEHNHVISVLAQATDECRESISRMAGLFEQIVPQAIATHVRFHDQKIDGKPALTVSKEIKPYTQAREALESLIDIPSTEATTYSVHYADINGLSQLENLISIDAIATTLEKRKIGYRISHSSLIDYTNHARGFSISILPLSSQDVKPQSPPNPAPNPTRPSTNPHSLSSKAQMTFNDPTIRSRITKGCKGVIAAEPTITEYDQIVGDGDCGYTLRDGAKQVLQFIEGRDLTQLPDVVNALVGELEVKMGGTSGALYCIYLTALAGALGSAKTVPQALEIALKQLQRYTRARKGDRTLMDALIPYVETLCDNGDAQAAVDAAREGVEGTRKMEAHLGRSTYLDNKAIQGVPDPGAYGLLVLLENMS
ncbi:Dak phosphatase [Piedraia hortae CBS 480.64]|uniref:Dak phosphatase n=1 Tax=Piedraia hortae CBS 480.64 TaxID=1314780 RepID=A0A6A7CAJ8_9PEZI|nr:Dak phosphatase [Piedraia hortae CBS 480.64]